MSYLEKKVLTDSEKVVIRVEKNPIFLVLRWIWGVLGFWLFFIPTLQAIKFTIKYLTTEYLITEKNALEKRGWISTHTDEMPLSKIENIVVNYTFFGKIFNYGEISIQGTNRNHINFYYIKNPENLKKNIKSLLEENSKASVEVNG